MKKLLASIALLSVFASGIFATSFEISRFALRDISDDSSDEEEQTTYESPKSYDSDFYDSDDEERTPYKSTKKLRGWQHGLLIGMSISNGDISIKLDDGKLDAELTAVDFQVGGLSMNLANGFTLKYDYNIGYGSSDNVNVGVDQGGFDMSFNFGIGWSPLRKEHFRLAVLGTLGFSMDYISGDKPYEGNDGNTYMGEASDFLWDFNLGFDILAVLQFNKHFGIYFDFALKGILGGSDSYTFTDIPGNKYDDDYDISGSHLIPSFGVLINF